MYKYQWRGIALMLSVVLLLIGFTTTNAKYVENKQISVNLRVGAYCGEVLTEGLDGKLEYDDKADTVHLAYRDQGRITSLLTSSSNPRYHSNANASISYANDDAYFGGLMRFTAKGANPSITFDCHEWGGASGINTSTTRYLLIGYYCPKTTPKTESNIEHFNSLRIYFSTRDVYDSKNTGFPSHSMAQPFSEGCRAHLQPSFTADTNSRWVFTVIDLYELLGAGESLRWLRIDLGTKDSTTEEEQTEKVFYLASLRFFSSYTSAVTIANILEQRYNGYTGNDQPENLSYEVVIQ